MAASSQMQGELRVMIVDHDPAAAKQLSDILANRSDIRIAAICNNAGEGLTAARMYQPGLIFADMSTTGDISAYLIALRSSCPTATVIIMASIQTETEQKRAEQLAKAAGANAFCGKPVTAGLAAEILKLTDLLPRQEPVKQNSQQNSIAFFGYEDSPPLTETPNLQPPYSYPYPYPPYMPPYPPQYPPYPYPYPYQAWGTGAHPVQQQQQQQQLQEQQEQETAEMSHKPKQPRWMNVAKPDTGKQPDTPRVIVIYSGKGGVGKTTVTVNLAASIAALQRDRKVVVIDLDTDYCSVATAVGVTPINTLTDWPKEGGESEEELRNYITKAPHTGFDLVAGVDSELMVPLVTRELVNKMIDDLKRIYDIVIIDTGNRLSPAVMTAIEKCDQLVLVTFPQMLSIQNLHSAINDLRRSGGIGESRVNNAILVLNDVGGRHAQQLSTDEISQLLRLKVSKEIPHDEAVHGAENECVPVVARNAGSPASKAFIALAREIFSVEQPNRRTAKQKVAKSPFAFRKQQQL